MLQFVLTPAAGKRLIGKALAAHPTVQAASRSATLVIIAGTTNGYAAEEILLGLGQADGFSRKRFFRGIVLPPGRTTKEGRLPNEGGFPGDVVIVNGIWQKGKTIFDVVDELKEGDIILKGANALDLTRKQAAVLIGHPRGGTTISILQAAAGKRVLLILPVGLEKRVPGDLMALAARMNAPGESGFRLLPVPGEVFTEIEAIRLLTGADAEMVAAGGVGGAEGAVWLALRGSEVQLAKAAEIIKEVSGDISQLDLFL
ncbi:MAG: hypothetical protein M0Q43_04825 [Methanothrix sp.]|jgi:hypothetical protein|nr:hypothetical protein [Methanothrix sp.]